LAPARSAIQNYPFTSTGTTQNVQFVQFRGSPDEQQIGPSMADISTVDARNRFADFVNRVGYGKERIILTRHGKPVAAMIPIEDLEYLEAIEADEDAYDLQVAEERLRTIDEEGNRSIGTGQARDGH
jgi:prevent-host-death family protein